MVTLKTERDLYDIKALELISASVADEAKSLSEKFNLSVEELLNQALGLFRRSGLDQHRSRVREFWKSLSPEERKERASKAAKAGWEKRKQQREASAGPDEAQASATKAGT